MADLLTGSRVKELQAMLFPVQPIPGKHVSSIQEDFYARSNCLFYFYS